MTDVCQCAGIWIAGVLDVEIDAVLSDDGKTPLTIKPPREGYGDITVAKSRV